MQDQSLYLLTTLLHTLPSSINTNISIGYGDRIINIIDINNILISTYAKNLDRKKKNWKLNEMIGVLVYDSAL